MIEKKEYNIPDKLYFRIGEVSDLVGVKPYVLRYWESEFGDIKPSKSKSGQRLYKRKDVETLMQIKELLYAQRFTIDGARRKIKGTGKDDAGKDIEGQMTLDLLKPATASSPSTVSSSPSTGVSSGRILLKLKMELEAIRHELNRYKAYSCEKVFHF